MCMEYEGLFCEHGICGPALFVPIDYLGCLTRFGMDHFGEVQSCCKVAFEFSCVRDYIST